MTQRKGKTMAKQTGSLVDATTTPLASIFGSGVHASKYLRLELGYLWRFELERTPPNKSDQVIRIQLHFATNGRHPSRGGS